MPNTVSLNASSRRKGRGAGGGLRLFCMLAVTIATVFDLFLSPCLPSSDRDISSIEANFEAWFAVCAPPEAFGSGIDVIGLPAISRPDWNCMEIGSSNLSCLRPHTGLPAINGEDWNWMEMEGSN